MPKKIGDKKITGVKTTEETKTVQETGTVGTVTGVKATTGVGSIKSPLNIGKRRPTRIMSLAEREHLFSMISEEADKMFGDTLSPDKKELVKSAVKMAVDASLVEDPDAANLLAGAKPKK